MKNLKRVLCIGEILWDALPSGLYLGGAPLNVCYHLNQMGIKAEICSRVGRDRLGEEALRRMKQKGMSVAEIQYDDRAETGYVKVEVKENGDPSYEIIKPVAWDFIERTASLEELAKNSGGLVFGSLAQRHKVSRATIQALWEYDLTMILDLNLRFPHVDKKVINDSLKVADIVKMNEKELALVREWYDLSGDSYAAVEELAARFGCGTICVTRGAEGAMLFQGQSWHEHPGFPIQSEDSVGAGDAFLAAMICGIQKDKKGAQLLEYANAAGSLVAQTSGATPEYNPGGIERIIAGNSSKLQP